MEQRVNTGYHTTDVFLGVVAGVEGAGVGAGGEGQGAALHRGLGLVASVCQRGRTCPLPPPRYQRNSRNPHGPQCRCPR